MPQALKAVYQWIMYSSVNSQKISLTIKAGIPLTLSVLAFAGISDLSAEELNSSVDALFVILNSIIMIVSAIGTVYGVFRKIVNTIFNR